MRRKRNAKIIATPGPASAGMERLRLLCAYAVGGGNGHVHELRIQRAFVVALEESIARIGGTLVIMAGMPFGISGTTNMLRIAQVERPGARAANERSG